MTLSACATIKQISLIGCLLLALVPRAKSGEPSSTFSNFLAQAEIAEKNGNVQAASRLYDRAETMETRNAANLCVLTKHYCDLMYATESTELKKTLAQHALACAHQAVIANPQSATAHLCVAVCYAKNCPFVDLSTKVAYSRWIKLESEKAIALDPHSDIAYYLLGRWHYGVANMNLFARTFVRVIYGGQPQASNQEAIENLKKAIALNPHRIIHHAALARAYAAAGEMKLARVEWEKCQALKPIDHDDADAQHDAAEELAHF